MRGLEPHTRHLCKIYAKKDGPRAKPVGASGGGGGGGGGGVGPTGGGGEGGISHRIFQAPGLIPILRALSHRQRGPGRCATGRAAATASPTSNNWSVITPTRSCSPGRPRS